MITLAEIPSVYMGIGASTFGSLVIIWLVTARMLKAFQDARTALVKEVKLELSAAAQPQQVSVQSPLTVKAEIEFAKKEDHAELEESFKEFTKTVDERFRAMNAASSLSREKVYNLIRDNGASLRREVKEDIGHVHERMTAMLQAVARIEGKMEK